MKKQKIKKSYRHRLVAGAVLLGLGGTTVQAATFTEALTAGKAKVDLRFRYENVDQDNGLDEADALTVRTRLGYGTGTFNGFSAYIEMENITGLVEDYNSGPGGNGKTDFSVVADPEGTEVNQAFIAYDDFPSTTVKYGRQRIILDNARFVGNVGWRQNEQTYDAFLVKNTALPDTTITYSYLSLINNIFAANVDTETQILNVQYTGLPFGTLTGYGYFVEFPDAEATSQKTTGIRLAGGKELDSAKLIYTVELATQSDYKDGDGGIDADYSLLEVGIVKNGITAKIGRETLGADDFSGFETPLATKHAFNGWADVFLNTPTDGLQDTFVAVSGKIRGIKLLGVYHDYEADSGGDEYGSELDLLAVKKFGKHYSAGLKYASYDADDYSVDTDKIWLWGQVKF